MTRNVIAYLACLVVIFACSKDTSSIVKEDQPVILPYNPQDQIYDDEDDWVNLEDSGPDDQDPVPEPFTLGIVGIGVTLIYLCQRKKKCLK